MVLEVKFFCIFAIETVVCYGMVSTLLLFYYIKPRCCKDVGVD